ncbi:HNH endonuclease [Bacillus cereus]
MNSTISEIELKVIELHNNGLGYKRIADELGFNRDKARYLCKKLGLKRIEESLHNREKQFKDKFESKHKGFIYDGGYEHSDGYVEVIHQRCGKQHKRSVGTTRHKENVVCPHCHEIKNNLISVLREEINTLDEQNKEIKKSIKELNKRLITLDLLINSKRKCRECGIAYHSTNNSFCSSECKNKYNNRVKELRRREQLKQNGKIDYGITMQKLYERDKGICHICNGRTNLKVHYNDDSYPTIDHLTPVVKGGTHTWDNVKIAHRKCNTLKRDKDIFSDQTGQLKLSL